jgi:3-hydroxyisobutyrate dehydrogenase-like beta-hydroxyacid dehydrogenase
VPDIADSRILIVATDGFEESELFGPREILVDQGATVKLASPERRPIQANNYDGGFAAALMLKDLKLAMEAAKQVGLELEMGEEAEEEFEKFVGKGGGNKDFSGIIKMIDGSWEA